VLSNCGFVVSFGGKSRCRMAAFSGQTRRFHAVIALSLRRDRIAFMP